MKQATLVIIVAAVLVALGVGFLGGRALMTPTTSDDITALRAKVDALAQKVDALSHGAAGGTGAGGSFRAAYIDMFKVLSKYKGTQGPLAQFQQMQQQLAQQVQDLDKQFQEGKLTKAEHDQKVSELQIKLQRANLELSAPIQQKIIAIVKQLGQEKGYLLILDNEVSQAQASVLYAQAGVVDDITEQVIEQINAQDATNNPGK